MTLEHLLPPSTTPRNNFYELPLFELWLQKVDISTSFGDFAPFVWVSKYCPKLAFGLELVLMVIGDVIRHIRDTIYLIPSQTTKIPQSYTGHMTQNLQSCIWYGLYYICAQFLHIQFCEFLELGLGVGYRVALQCLKTPLVIASTSFDPKKHFIYPVVFHRF